MKPSVKLLNYMREHDFKTKWDTNNKDAVSPDVAAKQLNNIVLLFNCSYTEVDAALALLKQEDEDESWIDPAGGVHYGDEDDPAKMYE